MARSVDRSIPPWATRSASDFSFVAVEPAVRRVVAQHLGVGAEELSPEVSLTDELAADSLDLVELAVALETEWGIVIPDRTVQAIRTYRDLVDALTSSLLERPEPHRRPPVPAAPFFARTRVVPAGDGVARQAERTIERTGELTPYAVEILLDEVRRAGPGARVEMDVPAATDDAGLAATLGRMAKLAARRVEVSVRRERRTFPAA